MTGTVARPGTDVDGRGEVVMEARGIVKNFGSVQALAGASMQLRAGEVTALVGDNGAGKSTLVKIMSGVYPPDAGQVLIGGSQVTLHDPLVAKARGIHTVFQDLALVEALTSVENMFLGAEERLAFAGRRIPWIDKRRMARHTREALGGLGISDLADVDAPVESLSGGQRQTLAIARAVREKAYVLILDEPTASLGVTEASRVLRLMDNLREAGTGVLVISHNLREVFSVTENIVVLRFGRVVAEFRTDQTSADEVVEAMLGRGRWSEGEVN
jgi:ABC-type sugar transport system ATPase subunit